MPITRLREFGPVNAGTLVHSVSGVPAYAVILSASRESDTGLLKVNAWTSAASKGLSSSPLNPQHTCSKPCASHNTTESLWTFQHFQRSKPIGGQMTWICSSVSELWLTMVWTDPVQAGQGVSIEWIKASHCIANIQCWLFLKIRSLLAMWTYTFHTLTSLLSLSTKMFRNGQWILSWIFPPHLILRILLQTTF